MLPANSTNHPSLPSTATPDFYRMLAQMPKDTKKAEEHASSMERMAKVLDAFAPSSNHKK